MLAHYLTLGLPPSASPGEIRRRYLELIRRHPPSREPERTPGLKTLLAAEGKTDE